MSGLVDYKIMTNGKCFRIWNNNSDSFVRGLRGFFIFANWTELEFTSLISAEEWIKDHTFHDVIREIKE